MNVFVSCRSYKFEPVKQNFKSMYIYMYSIDLAVRSGSWELVIFTPDL